jgi:hypothetical protein
MLIAKAFGSTMPTQSEVFDRVVHSLVRITDPMSPGDRDRLAWEMADILAHHSTPIGSVAWGFVWARRRGTWNEFIRHSEAALVARFIKRLPRLMPGWRPTWQPIDRQHRPDLWITDGLEVLPVEAKAKTFGRMAVVQLRRYMDRHEKMRGVAIARRLTAELDDGMKFFSCPFKERPKSA